MIALLHSGKRLEILKALPAHYVIRTLKLIKNT
jgi:hypothetical protein